MGWSPKNAGHPQSYPQILWIKLPPLVSGHASGYASAPDSTESDNAEVGTAMKPDIHPEYAKITVTCSCGHEFTTKSTLKKEDLHIEICSACHPFYTGKQKIVDTAGRIDKFRRKYGMN